MNHFLAFMVALVLLPTQLVGQDTETSQPTKTHVGIGISLEPLRLFSIGSTLITNAQTPVNIYVPIKTSNTLTVEPELGIFSYSSESGSSGSTTTRSASIVRVGVGVLAAVTSTPTVNVYAGPRVGFYLVNSKSSSSSQFGSSSSETSETDFSLGASLGSEYFVTGHMSIGGEALMTYYIFGEPTQTPSSGTATSLTRNMIASNVLFFLRWYF